MGMFMTYTNTPALCASVYRPKHICWAVSQHVNIPVPAQPYKHVFRSVINCMSAFDLWYLHLYSVSTIKLPKCVQYTAPLSILTIFNRMENNYTGTELNYNQWDKWGHHKDTSNKDLMTCFDCNKQIFSTRTTLSACSGEPNRQFFLATARIFMSTALMPVF